MFMENRSLHRNPLLRRVDGSVMSLEASSRQTRTACLLCILIRPSGGNPGRDFFLGGGIPIRDFLLGRRNSHSGFPLGAAEIPAGISSWATEFPFGISSWGGGNPGRDFLVGDGIPIRDFLLGVSAVGTARCDPAVHALGRHWTLEARRAPVLQPVLPSRAPRRTHDWTAGKLATIDSGEVIGCLTTFAVY